MNRVFAWPVGHGKYSLSFSYSMAYAGAAALGGLGLGSGLAVAAILTSKAPGGLVQGVGATLIFVGSGLQLTGRMGFLPQRHAQVPSLWLKRAPGWYSIAFGFTLGLTALTFLHYPVAYALFAGIFVRGDPQVALLAGLTLGAMRGLGVVAARALFQTPSAATNFAHHLAGQRFRAMSRVLLTSAGVALLVQTLLAMQRA